MDRKFIAAELDEKYYKVISNRLEKCDMVERDIFDGSKVVN